MPCALNEGHGLIENRDWIGGWETFTCQSLRLNDYGLKTKS